MSNSAFVERLEIRHANTGVQVYTSLPQTLWQCLWRSCNVGISAYGTTVYLYELFMCDVPTPTSGGIFVGSISTDCGLASKPLITTDPASQAKSAGQSATFTVVATGWGLNYQWYFNGASIPGATGPSYTRSSVQHTHAGNYHVVVANDFGYTRSPQNAFATLTVNGPPQITLQPASQTVSAGSSVTFAVGAIGGPPHGPSNPFWFTWYKEGNVVANSPNHEFTLSNVQTTDAGYYVVVWNNGVQVIQPAQQRG